MNIKKLKVKPLHGLNVSHKRYNATQCYDSKRTILDRPVAQATHKSRTRKTR